MTERGGSPARILGGWAVAFLAVALALLGLVWLGGRSYHPFVEILVVFGYIVLASLALVFTTAAVERSKGRGSVPSGGD